MLLLWLLWGNKALMTEEFFIRSPRIPAAFDGFRITQVSDLHNAEFGRENEKLLALLRDSRPDSIVITGDMVDSRHTDVELALQFARNAAEIAPTYYVSGNHEAWITQYDTLKAGLSAAGVIILEDEALPLERNGEALYLLGLQDPDFTLPHDLFGEAAAMTETKLGQMMPEHGEYTVLLSHRPELFESYKAAGVDLALTGHAHGGQIRLPFVGGLFAPDQGLFPKYDAGLFTEGQTNMIVSRGLGNSILPLRVNNRPELVTAILQKD